MRSQDKTPRQAKAPRSWKTRGWGRRRGSGAERCSRARSSNANSWSARSLRPPPLEHRWAGGEPASQERTPGWPFQTMDKRSAKAAPQTASFAQGLPGAAQLGSEACKGEREAEAAWREARARAGGRGEPAVRTVPRPAPPGLRPSLALTASSHGPSWPLEGTRGRAAGN